MKKSIFYISDYDNYLYKCKLSLNNKEYMEKTNVKLSSDFFHSNSIAVEENKNDVDDGKNNTDNNISSSLIVPQKLKYIVIHINGYCLFFLFNELKISINYKLSVSKHLQTINKIILIKLNTPKREFLDYKSSEFTNRLAWEKAELDNIMSWLSTLGGAFSALGDYTNTCAEIAGKISVKQLELAMRFGDPIAVIRCKLYYSISLIQIDKLREARHLIKQQYELAKSIRDCDERIFKMCHGIWMKLQYCYVLRKQERLKKSSRNE